MLIYQRLRTATKTRRGAVELVVSLNGLTVHFLGFHAVQLLGFVL